MITPASAGYRMGGISILFLLLVSIILATTLHKIDEAIVIKFNAQRDVFSDLIWLQITNSAGILTYGTVVYALISYFFEKRKEIRLRYFAIVASGILSGLLSQTIKHLIHRVRPFHIFLQIHKLGRGGGWSYPSGHTCDAFFMAAIIALLFPKRTGYIMLVFSWAVLVGLSRIYLGVHYLSDVLAGIAIGGYASLTAFFMVNKLAHNRPGLR